jgi:hypothetical protein
MLCGNRCHGTSFFLAMVFGKGAGCPGRPPVADGLPNGLEFESNLESLEKEVLGGLNCEFP